MTCDALVDCAAYCIPSRTGYVVVNLKVEPWTLGYERIMRVWKNYDSEGEVELAENICGDVHTGKTSGNSCAVTGRGNNV